MSAARCDSRETSLSTDDERFVVEGAGFQPPQRSLGKVVERVERLIELVGKSGGHLAGHRQSPDVSQLVAMTLDLHARTVCRR